MYSIKKMLLERIKILALLLVLGQFLALSNAHSKEEYTANECFEGVSRATLKFNMGLDRVLFKPIAKGRFAINSTVGILGFFDPAEKMGFEKKSREDFGQTLAIWGSGTGCYFVLPVLGPTTARDALGLVGNTFLDPVYQITHNTEVMNRSYSEHNYYYYKGTDAVDFRSKNIESIDSLEKNSIDFYASVKSLYLQNRSQKIINDEISDKTQDDSDWEEIDSQ